MAGKVFINYRREDAKGEALALRTTLAAKLPRVELFMDVDGGIKPGQNFVRALDERVAGTDIFLCLIGAKWSGVTDDKAHRRLDNPDDFVRIEIASALKRDIPIIPVLVDDTRMPGEAELPDAIRLLSYKQAMRLRHDRFNADVDGIAATIKAMLAGPKSSGVPRWIVAASVIGALGFGGTAAPTALRLAGLDASSAESFGRERTELQRQIASLEDENKVLEKARGGALAALKSRQSELDGVRAQLATATGALTKAKDDLGKAEQQAKSAGDVKVALARVTALTKELEDQKRVAADAQALARTAEQGADSLKARLEAQIAGLTKDLDGQKGVSRDALAKVEGLNQQLLALRKQITASNEALDASERKEKSALPQVKTAKQDNGPPIASIGGTDWQSFESNGDICSYRFMKEGVIEYQCKLGGPTYRNGEWKQTGRSLKFGFNNWYATYEGEIDGARAHGTASNGGKNWTWEMSRVRRGN